MTEHGEPILWRCPGCPQPPEWHVDLDPLVARCEWLGAMGRCPQDPQWHAEGDVLTHVRMVCAALAEDPAWRGLPEQDRHVLFAAALLHDVAKPACTREEGGRIVSPGHAVVGMRLARQVLDGDPVFGDGGPPFMLRERIVRLVRHHGLPAHFIDKPDPQRAVITTSITTRCDQLAMLARADALGRVCPGDDMPDRVRLFAETAAECGCLDGPYPFASAYSRLHYLRHGDAPPTVEVFDPTAFEVVLLSGLPAAGKDTWVAKHAGDRPVVSLDELRARMRIAADEDQGPVIDAARAAAKDLLRARRAFVWNATNTTRMLREGLISLFYAYGGRVRIVYCEAPFATIRRRNALRSKPVPERIIDRLIEQLEVPEDTEAHAVEYAIGR